MRRLVFPVIVASGLVMIGSSAAFAEDPAPTVSAPSVAGKKMCAIKDERITEASGLVATRTGYVVINDSTDKNANKRIFFLNTKCEVTDAVKYSGKGQLDPEDLILSPDGKTLWVADIGDNNFDNDNSRPTIGLWSLPATGKGEPVLHRLSYPEGDKHDAEALLLNGDGTPLIITKEIGKPAGVYQPTAPLKKNNEEGVPMRRVAEIQPSATQTAGGPYARIGNKTISGGAVAPGGGKVALRTYTDALEWDVKNGDVVAALKGKPRTTGLPNETLGEAITYSADGKYFYTTSDMSGETEPPNYILRYTPATTIASAAKDGGDEAGGAWYANLELSDITYAVGGVGVLGLILVGVGAMGIVRHRKRVGDSPESSADSSSDGDFKNPLEGEPETELIGVGGAPQRAGVYGGARPAASGQKAGVYGGNANGQRPVNGQPARAGVYGGAPARGPQGQPPRGPQGQPPRGPQGQPPRGPQGQPPRGPQGQPPRGPQGQPPRGPQGQPPRGPQGQPPRGPQGQPPRGPQGQPPRGPQGQPPRGPQGQPPRGPQPRGGGGVYGGGQGGPPSARGGRNDFQQRPEGRFDGYGPRR